MIGDARNSLAPAEILDAIALLHASGVGSANKSEDSESIKRSTKMQGDSRNSKMN